MRTIAVLLVLWGCSAAVAQEDETEAVELTEGARRAVLRALEYLKTHQRDSGAWTGNVGFKINNGYSSTKDNADHVGITSLACMAFMAAGNLPGRGPYGQEVQRGLDYVLRCVRDDGFITDNDSRMYSHAFATLFLAEVYGMTHDPVVREKLKLAVGMIIKVQNAEGGWRYVPQAMDSDMSIVVCQVQALRAARNVGLAVPIGTIRRAQDYVRQSFDPRHGGFYYQISHTQRLQSRFSFALAAAGVVALQGMANYDDVAVDRGLSYLEAVAWNDPECQYGTYFFYYGHYYAVQAQYIAGLKWPNRWRNWYPRIRDHLVREQREDGRWRSFVLDEPNNPGPGENFATAMGALILQIPFRYLPIFQR